MTITRNSSRIPLAMLPGTLNDAELWAAQIAALVDVAECHVHDLSPFEDIRAMALSVLEAMPARFAVVGLSMGGYVALELCRLAPERVIGIALFDTTARADTGSAVARRSRFLDLAERGDFDAIVEAMLPLFLHKDRIAGDPALVERVRRMAFRSGLAAFHRHYIANRARPDSRPLLPFIRAPALVLCGEDDPLPPEDHAEMAGLLPDSRLVILPGCAHLPPMEAPEVVSQAIIDWLKDVSRAFREDRQDGVS